MNTMLAATLLMMFIIWAHKALIKCHTPKVRDHNINSGPSSINSDPSSINSDPSSINSGPSSINSGSIVTTNLQDDKWHHRAKWHGNNLFNKFNETLNIKLGFTKKLIVTVLLFIGCYYFVHLHAQMQMNLSSNTLHSQDRSANNPDGSGADNSYSKDSDNNQTNNFIDILPPNKIKTKFSDVAGMQEVKDDVQDIIQFLQNPKQFSRLGAKAPKGLLMYGPPGTGKTLMARAIAGEANVTFIAVSGSQFEEEYVGIGASRVRQLFQLARNSAPCIIFIDEVDAVAFKRNSGKSAPWLAQTVNQLLTEMDGLNDTKNSGIMVIAATNRLDVLDPAILRPGRFDRQVKLELPTMAERKSILKVHLNKVKISPDVEPQQLAKLSTGFSGADLANLVNEAAIRATKENKTAVGPADFDYAKDRIVLGSKRQAMQMSEEEKRITAYHEAGHTLVALSLSEHEPLYKVTIAPRGMSLGHTAFQPQTEKYSYSKRYIEHTIASALGGRIAEGLVFGEQNVTTGAENDFKVATDLAYKMVTQWGFSKRLKTLNDPKMHLVNKATIEQEVQAILDRNYAMAQSILQKNIDKLHKLAAALLEQETLEADEVLRIVGPMQRVGN